MATTEDELEKYKNHLEQLKRVQEAGKVGYWAVYSEKEFLEWSAETYKIFDLPYGKQLTFPDMLHYVHPDDRDWVDKKWQEATRKGEYAVVYRIISATQKIRWIEAFGDVVFDGENKFVRALGIVRDITEQKEAEIKLEALAKSLKRSQKIGKLGSWVVEASSPSLISINEEANIIFDWPENQPATMDYWMSTIHPDDQERVGNSWFEAINGIGDYDIEYRIVINNSIQWVKVVGEMEFDAERKFVKAVGVVKDITEHMIQQENLRFAKEQAEEANRLKSQFLANMSHEIRTPLNGVFGFSELLMKTSLDDTQMHYMTTLNQSAHILIGIINDILDFSKIEAGKLEMAEENVDLSELINQVKNIISFQLQKKNITVEVKIDSNVSPVVIADGLRLQQILVNLMSNAVKFTKEGKIELSIELLETGKQGGPNIRFSVRDTGIGISTENQTKIFEAFTQEDLSTTKKFGGTGLGLSISNGILSLMNSKLQLESEVEKGSRFYFDVALKPVEFDQDQPALSTSQDLSNASPSVKDDLKSLVLKILVVDDNDINMFLTKVLVQEVLPNAVILEALDGKMAVELFEENSPDMILMDIQMPVMNGYDATKRIRAIESERLLSGAVEKRMPIMALTAGILEGEKEKSMESGMDGFMEKPIKEDKLRSLILEWVSSGVKS